MKELMVVIFIMIVLFSCNDGPAVTENEAQDVNLTAVEVVNERMKRYNLQQFTSFIQLYDSNVMVYTYPDKLLGTGTDNIVSIFKPKFASKSIQVEIVNQMSNGDYVINHEIVTEDGIDTKYVSIYEVKNGLTKSVRFVRDH